MLSILVLAACVSFMYKVAEMESRSGVVWGAVTFGLCLLCDATIPLPIINVIIGLALSFGVMMGVKALEK